MYTYVYVSVSVSVYSFVDVDVDVCVQLSCPVSSCLVLSCVTLLHVACFFVSLLRRVLFISLCLLCVVSIPMTIRYRAEMEATGEELKCVPSAPCGKPTFVGSGESMVATLNLHGINGRVESAARCAQHVENPLCPDTVRIDRQVFLDSLMVSWTFS